MNGLAQVARGRVGGEIGPQQVHDLFAVQAVPVGQGEDLDQFGCPLVPPGVTLMSEAPVYSMPLRRNRLSCGRRPETEYMLPTDEFEVPTPPERCVV